MAFVLPQIDENLGGWGPTDKSLSIFENVPSYYTPYNKGDKLGKIADVGGLGHQGKQMRHINTSRDQQTNSLFSYSVQDDDSSFTVVKNPKATVKKTPFRRGGGFTRVGQTTQRAPVQNRSRTAKKNFKTTTRGGWGGRETATSRKREYSVEIKPDWVLKESIEFSTLNKLEMDKEPQGEVLEQYGEIKYYDTSMDRIASNSTRKALKPTNATFYNPSTADDSVMRDLSKKENIGTVFATDSILSHLMTCNRSVVPWDIIITKVGSKLFFDIREESNFDRYIVSEAATDIGSEENLSKEATSVNQNFTQQILNKEEGVKFEGEDPFALEGEERPFVGYFYKKWDLGDDIKLVARCEIDGALKNEKKHFISKALFEYDPKITGDWRKKIDTQRSSILISEMKTNPFKLSKWTAQASLASSTLKLGFVSRTAWRDTHNHVILSIQDYEPKEIATQISLNLKQAWAILRHIIRVCNKFESGKYALLRDNEKSVLRLYAVPADAFEVKDETQKE